MEFKLANKDSGNPPRFILEEAVNSSLDSTDSKKIYFVAKPYRCSYKLTSRFAGGNVRTLEFASKDDFKFFENRTSLEVASNDSLEFEIVFVPRTEGCKHFQLIVSGAGRQDPVIILDRYLKVEKVKPVSVKGYVENSLPIQIQLGEEQEIIFVFENKSSKEVEVRNFNITSKEIPIV